MARDRGESSGHYYRLLRGAETGRSVAGGVATWLDPEPREGQRCRRRIYEATLDARLIAIDAADGTPCADFGKAGQVHLDGVAGFQPGWYHMTSPPAVVGDVVVVGSSIDDNARVDMPAGVVRGYDARTGALRWSWDPIPPNRPGAKWQSGAANAWSVMSVDVAGGLVFVPTGSASPDYYGGLRAGDDHWSNAVVALHAATGKLAWGFQLVHHDLWDYDTAPPPLLTTLQIHGKPVQAVGGLAFIAGTIDPHLRAFDLDTGKLLWQTDLPTSGHATPMTYRWKGRQYVLIAAGGSAAISEEKQGDSVIAYALPAAGTSPP